MEQKKYSKRLEGKIALITGATGGIGEATSKRFLEEGASVMLLGRSEEKLKETKQRLADFENIASFVADVSDESAMAAAFESTIKIFGGIDILVANAGTGGKFGTIETLNIEDFESVLRTNIIGVWLSMKYAVAPMKKRGGGSIIALSSTAGMVGFSTMPHYIASKHAVFGLVKNAAIELAASNIRVNAVGPGSIDNQMMRAVEAHFSPNDPAAYQDYVTYNIPMGRYGTNEEVANLALFLASDESSYCTGGIHMIDGGYIAG